MNQQDGKKLAQLLKSSVKGLGGMTKILEKSLKEIQPEKVEKEVFEEVQKEVSRLEDEIKTVKSRHDEILSKL